MRKVNRVLLVGFGSIGKRHLNNLKLLNPQVKLVVLRSREGSNPIAGCDVITDIEAALDFQPQVAFICNPSNLHLSIATELARAGVHLFIEKPLSNNSDGLEEFMSVFRSTHIQVMVGYNLRFSESLCTLRELIRSKQYGRALHVTAEVGQYLPDWRPDSEYRNTVSARADLGGGALLELSHELDYMCWIFGEPICVSGQLLKVSDLDIDVEDLVLAHVAFNNEEAQISSTIQLDFLQRKPSRTCKVICEQATLIWDAIEDRVEALSEGSVSVEFQGDKDRNYSYKQEVLHFIESINRGEEVPIPVEDGIKVLGLIHAIRQSSKMKKVIHL